MACNFMIFAKAAYIWAVIVRANCIDWLSRIGVKSKYCFAFFEHETLAFLPFKIVLRNDDN